MGAQLAVVELVIIGQEMRTRVERIGYMAGRIQLGAVARREDGRFVVVAQVDALEPGTRRHHRRTQMLRRKRQLFAKRHWGGGMVEADGEQLHFRAVGNSYANIIAPCARSLSSSSVFVRMRGRHPPSFSRR